MNVVHQVSKVTLFELSDLTRDHHSCHLLSFYLRFMMLIDTQGNQTLELLQPLVHTHTHHATGMCIVLNLFQDISHEHLIVLHCRKQNFTPEAITLRCAANLHKKLLHQIHMYPRKYIS